MITKKSHKKSERRSTRVDFTPMVDMNMLLLTFFMFCTTLSRPQVMELAMPVPDTANQPNAPQSQTVTFILSDKDKVYYYEGMPNYEDHSSLKEITYTEIRDILLRKNSGIMAQINKVKEQTSTQEQSQEAYKNAVKEIKRQKEGAVAIIKPTEGAVFENLVNILDEMAICNIGRYAVSDLTEGDLFLIEDYKSKGALVAQ